MVSLGKGREFWVCTILISVPYSLQIRSWRKALPWGCNSSNHAATVVVLSQGGLAELIEKIQGRLKAKTFTMELKPET